jgi:hypothetical protein
MQGPKEAEEVLATGLANPPFFCGQVQDMLGGVHPFKKEKPSLWLTPPSPPKKIPGLRPGPRLTTLRFFSPACSRGPRKKSKTLYTLQTLFFPPRLMAGGQDNLTTLTLTPQPEHQKSTPLFVDEHDPITLGLWG